MNKKRNVIVSVIIVILLICVVATITYAYLVAITNEESVDTGSGMLGIEYVAPVNLTGDFMASTDRTGGLKTTAKASLKEGSEAALFNMYITPTALTNLNIPALKWEAEGLRDTNGDGINDIVCSMTGDFSSAVVNEKFKIIDSCGLSTDVTTFNIYVWLDISLIESAVGGASFGAKIGADSVPITGGF